MAGSFLSRRVLATCLGPLALVGCNTFNEDLERRLDGTEEGPRECDTHPDCASHGEGYACNRAGGCVPLTSEDCQTVTGELRDDAIIIGSLLSVTGAQAATNIPRQQAAILAVEQFNDVGGVPGMTSGTRPLVLVSCDEAANLDRAASHLIDELKVPAIIGPNVSQDVIEVTNRYSVAGDTVLISPTAVASSIADLDDMDLTWQLVPTDEQREPLMSQQIGVLESAVHEQDPDRPVRLSIIHRNDAIGIGTRVALNNSTLNGMSLAENQSDSVKAARVEPYDASDGAAQAEIVQRQLEFLPDIIVIAGFAEAVTNIMAPLEKGWPARAPRPSYVLIDSTKVPELLALAGMNDDLRARVRGTGIVPTAPSSRVYDSFLVDFQTRFPESPSGISGMGPAYDGVYAVGFALAATRGMPVTGSSVAMGLRMLGEGPKIEVSPTRIVAGLSQLSNGNGISAIGTFAPLQFDENGAPSGGRVEVWCIASGDPPRFASSSVTYDLETRLIDGTYNPCE